MIKENPILLLFSAVLSAEIGKQLFRKEETTEETDESESEVVS